jgi:hypothetical protein
MDIVDEDYPNFEHSTKVMRGIYDMSCYKEMLQARQVALCAAFYKKADSYSESEPKPSPSSST